MGHFIKAAGDILHRGNNFAKLHGHIANLTHATAHLPRKVRHFLHARAHAHLHLAHHALNIQRGGSCLIGKPRNFTSHHQETKTVFASFFGFNRGIYGKQIGLIRHLGHGAYHHINFGGALVDG